MYYAIKDNAYEGMQGLGKGTSTTLRDVFLIDDEFHIKYIDKNGKEYGDEIEEKILEDETEIRFASKAFSEYISKISGVTETEMKFKWMKNQTSLTIDDANITSLEDLVFFPNLKSLTLGGWTTTARQMIFENLEGIGNCTNLSTFRTIYASIKSLSGIENCQNLTTIYITSPAYSPEDFENFSSLTKLSDLQIIGKCNYSNLIEAIKNIDTLSILHLKSNFNITSMKDLKKLNGDLTILNLSNNKITKIEGIEKFSNLKTISLTGNNIEDITPLAKNTNLTSISLNNNANIDANRENYTGEKLIALNAIGKILDNGGNINLDIDKLKLFTNYTSLDLAQQNLENLKALDGLTELTSLSLTGNKLTLDDEESQNILKSMTKLKSINLRKNSKITDISFVNSLENLAFLNIYECSNIDLKQIENKISNLSIRCSNDTFLSIMNCNEDIITKLDLCSPGYGHSIAVPDLSKFSKLTSLILLNDSSITDFSNISKIKSLETLNLSACELYDRMIDFSNLSNLKTLSLSSNSLWTSDLENLKALRNLKNLSLNLSSNSIIDATALLELDSSTKINLKDNVNLTTESKNALKEKFGSNVSF